MSPVEDKHTKAFFDALPNMLKEMCLERATQREVNSNPSSDFKSLGLAFVVAVLGRIEGHVILDISRETAMGVTELIDGEPVDEFNELVKSSLCELINLIAGKGMTALHDEDEPYMQTTPIMIDGDNLMVKSFSQRELVWTEFESSQGIMRIYCSLETRTPMVSNS